MQVNSADLASGFRVWDSASINLSDADPARVPDVTSPLSYFGLTGGTSAGTLLAGFNSLFAESGSTQGLTSAGQEALHAAGPLHAGDPNPVRLYAAGADLSGVTLFAGKAARVIAERDLTDVAFYLQNTAASDFSLVSAGRDLVAYDPSSPLREAAQAAGNQLANFVPGLSVPASGSPTAGDLQIGGPGTLEVLAGRNLDLGVGTDNPNGTQAGVVSIGNARNPHLPFTGASLIVSAGLGLTTDLADRLETESFLARYLGTAEGRSNLSEIAPASGNTDLTKMSPEEKSALALNLFFTILRDAGRSATATGGAAGSSAYDSGFAAIRSLFGSLRAEGDIHTRGRDIRSKSGGSISILAPGGSLALADTTYGASLAPPGILTEDGGNVSIFTRGNVDLGVSRIFTLRGGNIVIWSSEGDIAAGASPKTVQTAPPTRVLVDPQSGDVETDLAGLATGGGIGVLATVGDVAPGNVDLIAPRGTVDAGDAGIRATGNLNIAAVQVLNADNIRVAGSSTGTPAAAPSGATNIGGFSAASNAGAPRPAAPRTPPVRQRTPRRPRKKQPRSSR